MKSAAQKAYEKVQKSLLMAPGMIEEGERRLLLTADYLSLNSALFLEPQHLP